MDTPKVLVIVTSLVATLMVWLMGVAAFAITSINGKMDDNLGGGLFFFCVAASIAIGIAAVFAHSSLVQQATGKEKGGS